MQITGKTMLTGVMGYPVAHSLSPVFQNAAYEHLGLRYVYVPLEVKPESLANAIKGIKACNFRGVNLTIPHKKEAVRYLDEISEESGRLGVVNTIINDQGRLRGDITDGLGFIRSLKQDGGFNPKGKNVFIFGAGGASYAISGALAREGIKGLFICNRTEEKAVLLKKHLSENLGFRNVRSVPFEKRNNEEFWKKTELLVNTTSLGMKPDDKMLAEEENLARLEFVYDIVYNRITELLKRAIKHKIPCLDGISMLIYQGAVSFELWTGKKAPVEVMKESLSKKTKY